MSNLDIDFLEQILRVRVDSDDALPDDKLDGATEFARAQVDEIYGKDAYLWEFSEVKRVGPRKVDVIFFYMD